MNSTFTINPKKADKKVVIPVKYITKTQDKKRNKEKFNSSLEQNISNLLITDSNAKRYRGSLNVSKLDDELKSNPKNCKTSTIKIDDVLKDFQTIQAREFGSNSNVPDFLNKEVNTSYWGLFYRQLFPENKDRQTLLKRIIKDIANTKGIDDFYQIPQTRKSKLLPEPRFKRKTNLNLEVRVLKPQNIGASGRLLSEPLKRRQRSYNTSQDYISCSENSDNPENKSYSPDIAELIKYRNSKNVIPNKKKNFIRLRKMAQSFGVKAEQKFKEILDNTEMLEQKLTLEKKFTKKFIQQNIERRSSKKIINQSSMNFQRLSINDNLATPILGE